MNPYRRLDALERRLGRLVDPDDGAAAWRAWAAAFTDSDLDAVIVAGHALCRGAATPEQAACWDAAMRSAPDLPGDDAGLSDEEIDREIATLERDLGIGRHNTSTQN